MIANLQAVENRRLAVARTTIEDEKQRQIEASRAEMENGIRGIQNTIKLMAVALPPIPAFVVFVLVSIRRLRRERIGASRRTACWRNAPDGGNPQDRRLRRRGRRARGGGRRGGAGNAPPRAS